MIQLWLVLVALGKRQRGLKAQVCDGNLMKKRLTAPSLPRGLRECQCEVWAFFFSFKKIFTGSFLHSLHSLNNIEAKENWVWIMNFFIFFRVEL